MTPQRLALRAGIILGVAAGFSQREVARRLGIHRHTVALWIRRFDELGLEGLKHDKPGRGRKRST